ncbi:MAG TPA: SUMF1/EgtB/PvdO family nonheme iron enzyme [Bacteroidales bacterium]|nr:SUMF1/EgtB/PvdO family nonheme iron enzyme [Bacteroidales bacterium]
MDGLKGLRGFFIVILIFINLFSSAQQLSDVQIAYSHGLTMNSVLMTDSSVLVINRIRPLYSFLLNGKPRNSSGVNVAKNGNEYTQIYDNGLQVNFTVNDSSGSIWKGKLVFINTGRDTLIISNCVPFGEDSSSVYITGNGPADLARAWLFRPGYKPLRVVLPDNAWELGYSSFYCNNNISLCSVIRRRSVEKGLKKRYESVLPPKASVSYNMYTELYSGEWQVGLRKILKDRFLYDVDKFDNTLFDREDLAWIKESYIIVLQMAWDKEFYDRFSGKFTYPESLKKYKEKFGNLDVFGIWPTWPRLGLDQRNQWDLYRDLPGGLEQLRNFVRMSQMEGTKFFISYNPWDNSTRKDDHFRGLSKLIADTEADGVVLDTRGNSGPELQEAADSVRKGVVMYSEGMAVPEDMQGIVSGRVHNALFLSPELNLNKLIKPDFAIFRVCDVGEDVLHREIAVAFFNGYGSELNMFRPGGRGESFESDLSFLAKTTFILRQNNDAFLDQNWNPLISTTKDRIYVNKWSTGDKIVYTILNMRHEGVKEALFPAEENNNFHYVSLWNHEAVVPVDVNGKKYLTVNAGGWESAYNNTRKEGSVDCIAGFRELLHSKINGDSLILKCLVSGKLNIWKGDPAFNGKYVELKLPVDTAVRIRDLFGYYEGKLVLQVIADKRLKDENILKVTGGKPWLISKVVPASPSETIPDEMVLVPGSTLIMNLKPGDEFIPYPDISSMEVVVDSFLIDRYPVTNAEYYEFINSSGYKPADTAGYLRHWQSGIFRQGQDKYPVVNVSFEDMKAYARWTGKRLPTQAEWQLAAQGTDKRKWPWGNDFHGTYCNNTFNRQTPVDAFPKGQSPYGAMDMVGNIWQMTNDIYFNGTNYFGIIRGGSYFKPESSWWYLQGGPQSLDNTQIMLLVSPGFDRSSTVGFRCVREIDKKKFRLKK